MGLIRLEFIHGRQRIGFMSTMVASGSPENKPKLLERVRDVVRRKQYSIRTEQVYVDWIKRFILYHNKRHPNEMAQEEVAEFLTHLARDRNVAPATQNQALSALLFDSFAAQLSRPLGPPV